MGLLFDSPNAKVSQGSLASVGGCDLPSSAVGEYLFLAIAYVQPSALSTTLNAPTVGAVTGTLVASTTGVSVYSFPGGTSGTAQFTFSTNPCAFTAYCIKESGQKSTTPFSSAYTASTTGFTHLLNAGTTAPFPGAVFIAFITQPVIPLGGVSFTSPDNLTEYKAQRFRNFPGDPDTYQAGLSVAVRYADEAGDAGAHTWSSVGGFFPSPTSVNNAASCGFWISPSQAPSAPDFTSPTTNALYAVGRLVPTNWLSAIDPNIVQASLTYELDYTLNGNTWTNITTTSAGVLTYSWNTAGLTPSTQVQVRGRAYNGTEFGQYGYSDVFTLLADAAPGPPQNVLPIGIVNQAEDLTITFTFNDPGDLQKTLEVQYSANADMSSPSTTGTITTGDSEYTFTASTGILTTAQTMYYRVRNQGVVDSTDGAWSAIKQIQVTAPISAPNITSPTAASPPTTGTHTATFTGTGHVDIQYRLEVSSVTIFTSAAIATSGNSFVIGISFQNGVTYTLYLKRRAADLLWSTEDSETFTVSYTGPAAPTVTPTAIDDAGLIEILVENSDAIEGQYIFIDGVQLDTPLLPADAVFNYAGATSGVEISIVVRAFVSTGTGGFTDSSAETVTQNLKGLFLFEPTKESTTGNFVAPPLAILADANEPDLITDVAMVRLRKRTKQIAHIRRGYDQDLNYSIMSPLDQISVINQLEAWIARGAQLCARDNFAHKVFGNIFGVIPTDWDTRLTLPLTIMQNDYVEEVES